MTPSKGPTVAVSTPQTATVVVVSESFYYKHVQSNPSSEWLITHNLGKEPNFTVHDSDGDEVLIGVDVTGDNTARVLWPNPTTGYVICS